MSHRRARLVYKVLRGIPSSAILRNQPPRSDHCCTSLNSSSRSSYSFIASYQPARFLTQYNLQSRSPSINTIPNSMTPRDASVAPGRGKNTETLPTKPSQCNMCASGKTPQDSWSIITTLAASLADSPLRQRCSASITKVSSGGAQVLSSNNLTAVNL